MEIRPLSQLERAAFSRTSIADVYCIQLSAPVVAQYEVNAGCNQRCYFCYNLWKNDRAEHQVTLPRKKRRQVIEKIIGLDVFEVIFSGGEPLLIPEISDLIGRLTEVNIRSYIITNGQGLTEEMASRLKMAGLGGLQISLHGSSPLIHDQITRRRGSFRKTMVGLRTAIAIFGPKPINVNMVLVRENEDDVGRVMQSIAAMGIKHFSLGVLSQTGPALPREAGTDRERFLTAFREMRRVSEIADLEIGISGGFPLCIFPPEERQEILNLPINICDAGLNQLVVSPSGEIRPCVCFPQVLGNILRDDPREIWNKAPLLNFFRRFEHVPPQCYGCKFVSICKGGCRAVAYSAADNFKALDPLLEEVIPND